MVCLIATRYSAWLIFVVTAFRGELTSHHPHFHPASPAAVRDIDIETAKQIYPNGLTVGIHMGEWAAFAIPLSIADTVGRHVAPRI